MEKSGFFNSSNGDRKYKAKFFAEYFSSFIGNGVFPNPSTGLQVIANTDMTITLKPGQAWINGYYYANDDNLILSIDVADGVVNRLDRVVLQYNTLDRTITAKVKKGKFASSPVAPTLQRDADAYELGVADIYIAHGATSITQANITDLRLNNTYCGIVHGTVDQVDTTTLFNQYQTWLAEKKAQYDADLIQYTTSKENEIDTWYTTTKTATEADISEFEQQYNAWYNTTTQNAEQQIQSYEIDISTWTTEKKNAFTTWLQNTEDTAEADINAQVMEFQNYFEIWFNNIKNQLSTDAAGNLQNQLNLLLPTIEIGTINHNLGRYPRVLVLKVDYGAGMAGVSDGLAGGEESVSIPIEATYIDRYSLKLKIPIGYSQLGSPILQKINENNYIVRFENELITSLLVILD